MQKGKELMKECEKLSRRNFINQLSVAKSATTTTTTTTEAQSNKKHAKESTNSSTHRKRCATINSSVDQLAVFDMELSEDYVLKRTLNDFESELNTVQEKFQHLTQCHDLLDNVSYFQIYRKFSLIKFFKNFFF